MMKQYEWIKEYIIKYIPEALIIVAFEDNLFIRIEFMYNNERYGLEQIIDKAEIIQAKCEKSLIEFRLDKMIKELNHVKEIE